MKLSTFSALALFAIGSVTAVPAPEPVVGSTPVLHQATRDEVVNRLERARAGLKRQAQPSAGIYPRCSGDLPAGANTETWAVFADVTGGYTNQQANLGSAANSRACIPLCKAYTSFTCTSTAFIPGTGGNPGTCYGYDVPLLELRPGTLGFNYRGQTCSQVATKTENPDAGNVPCCDLRVLA